MNEKMYFVMDLQDYADYHETTLEGAKEFLRNMWNDEDYETEEEQNKHLAEIEKADKEQLDEMLQGCDYTIFDTLEELKEYIK